MPIHKIVRAQNNFKYFYLFRLMSFYRGGLLSRNMQLLKQDSYIRGYTVK